MIVTIIHYCHTLAASGLGEQMGVKLGRRLPTNSLKEIQFPF